MEISIEILKFIAALIVCIGIPYLSMRLESKDRLPYWLNPIIICYASGLFCSIFLYQESNKEALDIIMYIAILLAISLHLLNTKLGNLKSYGKELITAYVVCVILAGIFSTMICLGYKNKIAEFDALSGMLSGLYSGGNLNLNAVGKSLGVSNELITSALYTDIFSGTILMLFLISIGPHFYALFLKKGVNSKKGSAQATIQKSRFLENPRANLKGIGYGLLVLIISLGPFYLPSISKSTKALILFLLISIISVVVGQTKLIKKTYQTEVSGDFFLLIFCTCISLNVDLKELLEISKALLPIYAMLIICIMGSHILICKLLGIDKDKTMVAFVAALYGVPFISQITNTLKAPSLLSGGIGLAVFGMAIGNIFGIAVAFICKYLGGLM